MLGILGYSKTFGYGIFQVSFILGTSLTYAFIVYSSEFDFSTRFFPKNNKDEAYGTYCLLRRVSDR
jgi:hypothetical protein